MTAVKKRRDPLATRSRILDAATELLAKGDGSIEMAWVAKKAGVSQGLAYHHFGSKDGLIAAVVNAFYDRLEAEVLMARIETDEAWAQRELSRVRSYIRFLLGDPLGVIITTKLAGTPAIAAVEAERWQVIVDAGARNIAEGQQTGAVASTQDSGQLAAMVLGASRSAVTRALQKEKRIDADQLAHDIWAFIEHGLSAGT